MLKLAYCDYIAHVVKTAVNQALERKLGLLVTEVKMDLNEDGSYRSPKRTIIVKDHNDKSYTITIEEAE